MTFSEYADTFSWQGALELAPRLLSLADELPASETMGLSLQLHQLAVELPASIAVSLIAGQAAELGVMLKLITVLELVDRVYPALDVAPVRRQADELAERLAGDRFTEVPQQAIALPAELDPPSDAEAEPAPDAEPALDPIDGMSGPNPNFRVPVQPPANPEEPNVFPNSQQ